MTNPNYFHVDVFADAALSGNGLSVFICADTWPAATMQALTREMKQFESIFLTAVSAAGATARVFTVDEELPFAGHPVLGAACVLHRLQSPRADAGRWVLRLPGGDVPVSTWRRDDHWLAEMDQGVAACGTPVDPAGFRRVCDRLGLQPGDLVPGIAPEVLSTGLPYLIVPVRPEALARAAITGGDMETLLAALGAKFVLVADVVQRELRTWDNEGRVEDVATGSAAGPLAAYLFRHGLADPAAPLSLAQGRFAGRPSQLGVRVDARGSLLVSGAVWPVAQGIVEANGVTGRP